MAACCSIMTFFRSRRTRPIPATSASALAMKSKKARLAGLAPYIRYGLQSQSIDTQEPTQIIPDSYTDVVVGADYRIWKLIFNVEQQWHDSTLVPFNATRAVGSISTTGWTATHRPPSSGNFAMLDYYGEHDYVNDASISAVLERKLGDDVVDPVPGDLAERPG